MITCKELEKTAASVEADGFEDENQERLEKTAQALYLLDHLEKEIASDFKGVDFEKTAGFGKKMTRGLAQTAVVGLGVAMAGKLAEHAEKSYDKHMFNKHQNGLIAFARRENPSLQGVSNGKMKMWLRSAYSVSPKVANDPMLASTFLNTAHAVGGVDLNTAKTVSDINAKGGGDYSKVYDAIRGSSSNLPSYAMSSSGA